MNATETDLVVTVPAQKDVLIGNKYASAGELDAEFARLRSIFPGRRILLRVDRATQFGKLRGVLHAASANGFSEFVLITFEGSAFDLLVAQRAA